MIVRGGITLPHLTSHECAEHLPTGRPSMTAIEIIDAEVRDVVRRGCIDPGADPGAIRTMVEQVGDS